MKTFATREGEIIGHSFLALKKRGKKKEKEGKGEKKKGKGIKDKSYACPFNGEKFQSAGFALMIHRFFVVRPIATGTENQAIAWGLKLKGCPKISRLCTIS